MYIGTHVHAHALAGSPPGRQEEAAEAEAEAALVFEGPRQGPRVTFPALCGIPAGPGSGALGGGCTPPHLVSWEDREKT